jgi:hypothetical protein
MQKLRVGLVGKNDKRVEIASGQELQNKNKNL